MDKGIIKSKCKCGMVYIIEPGKSTSRQDGKLVYPAGDDGKWCSFRCKRCQKPVHETVPGAEFDNITEENS